MKKIDTTMSPAFEEIPKKKTAKKRRGKTKKETMAEFSARRNKETKGKM